MGGISVIIPTYNRCRVLSTAIKSILKQSVAGWELIIVDDGSMDGTEELMKSLLQDSRIHYVFQENLGVSAARNRGAEMAMGKWLVFLDSDDQLQPNALEDFTTIAAENPNADVWVASYFRNKEGSVSEHLAKEDAYNVTLPGTFMIRKAFFEDIGGYDPQLKYAENTELFYRIAQEKGRIEVMDSFTLEYFDSTTGGSKNNKNKIDSLRLILAKHQESLSPHVRFLYLQIVGVSLMREGRYREASDSLREAYRVKPYQLKTLIRWGIARLPFLAKRFYPVVQA
ncbi:glycosyltransferase family 2 protein [Negadavirga shengliensis]|uniref:Glycosyltransferase family 2 protein n=1 Tax=Negadavirga shengliensis TaxID=1389218 RepID=A0ABV9T4D2_9BACT